MLPPQPHRVLGLPCLLACELGRHDGAVGSQGDAVALQPRPESLLQQLPLPAQVQRAQGQQQEVQPEVHEDAGVPVPADRGREARGGRAPLAGASQPRVSAQVPSARSPVAQHRAARATGLQLCLPEAADKLQRRQRPVLRPSTGPTPTRPTLGGKHLL